MLCGFHLFSVSFALGLGLLFLYFGRFARLSAPSIYFIRNKSCMVFILNLKMQLTNFRLKNFGSNLLICYQTWGKFNSALTAYFLQKSQCQRLAFLIFVSVITYTCNCKWNCVRQFVLKHKITQDGSISVSNDSADSTAEGDDDV